MTKRTLESTAAFGNLKSDDDDHDQSTSTDGPNVKLMKTDDVKRDAETKPLDKDTLDSIGLNLEALNIFVKRLGTAAEHEMLKKLALERIAQANLVKELDDAIEELDQVIEERDHVINKVSEERDNAIKERDQVINDTRSSFEFTDHPLGKMPDENRVNEGKLITINRYEKKRNWTVSLYIHQHLVDRFQEIRSFLNNMHKNRLYVTGAPGCGKTCFFWMWAGILVKQNRRMLFIQYRANLECHVWVLEGGARKRLTSPRLDVTNLKEAVDALLKTDPREFYVCICDGVQSQQARCEELMSSLTSWTGVKIAKLILVTSLQFKISDGERDDVGDAFMTIDLWRKEDYKKAVVKVNAPSCLMTGSI